MRVINAKKYMAKAAAVRVNSVFPSASGKAEVVLGGFKNWWIISATTNTVYVAHWSVSFIVVYHVL